MSEGLKVVEIDRLNGNTNLKLNPMHIHQLQLLNPIQSSVGICCAYITFPSIYPECNLACLVRATTTYASLSYRD